MMKYFKITVFTPDRGGLVATIAGSLYDAGINLGDLAFSVLGEGAEFTAVCEVPAHLDAQDVRDHLRADEGLAEAEITVVPFELQIDRSSDAVVTHKLALRGADHPGLVARLTETMISLGANIVRLNAYLVSIDSQRDYLIRIATHIPAGREEACIAAAQNTASSLNLEFSSEEVTHAPST